MTNGFSDSDRRLILRIAKRLGHIEERVDVLENVRTSVLKSSDASVESPLSLDDLGSSISLEFFAGQRVGKIEHDVLVNSLYTALKELCDVHGIHSMRVFITKEDNKK